MKSLTTTTKKNNATKNQLINALVNKNMSNDNNFNSICIMCEAGTGNGNGL